MRYGSSRNKGAAHTCDLNPDYPLGGTMCLKRVLAADLQRKHYEKC